MSQNNSNPSPIYPSVTPSDTVDIKGGKLCRSLYVGGAGDVVAVDESGNTTTFVGVQAGSILPIMCKRVNATNTSASNIVALY